MKIIIPEEIRKKLEAARIGPAELEEILSAENQVCIYDEESGCRYLSRAEGNTTFWFGFYHNGKETELLKFYYHRIRILEELQ